MPRLTLVGEGVETVDQGWPLAGLGRDQAQGWPFGRAMPAGEVESWSHSALRPRDCRGVRGEQAPSGAFTLGEAAAALGFFTSTLRRGPMTVAWRGSAWSAATGVSPSPTSRA